MKKTLPQKTQGRKAPEIRKGRVVRKIQVVLLFRRLLMHRRRDSTTNEILVKKHAEKGDLVFHTKIEGSPFFIIKSEGRQIGRPTIEEAAQATASYSKAWKLGMSSLETFYVQPEQLSKKAPSGEYVTKGAFTVKGAMNFVQAKIELAIGIVDGRIIGGPIEAVKKNARRCSNRAGQQSTSVVAGSSTKSRAAR
jgi:predicted ribosome quality control (RQC) complex YloA/Tae2 family protein